MNASKVVVAVPLGYDVKDRKLIVNEAPTRPSAGGESSSSNPSSLSKLMMIRKKLEERANSRVPKSIRRTGNGSSSDVSLSG